MSPSVRPQYFNYRQWLGVLPVSRRSIYDSATKTQEFAAAVDHRQPMLSPKA